MTSTEELLSQRIKMTSTEELLSQRMQSVIDTINQKTKTTRVRTISNFQKESMITHMFWTKTEKYLLDIKFDLGLKKITIDAIEYAEYPQKLFFRWENGQFFTTGTHSISDEKFFEVFDKLLLM